MKYIFSEESLDYKNYRFGYSVNAFLENKNDIEKCFLKGFLPYTGDNKNNKEIYYLARSLRVNLNFYQRLSENLRVIKIAEKSHNLNFSVKRKETFHYCNDFKKFCLKYSEERFINNPLSEKRLELILKRENYNQIFTFSDDNKIVGYVLAYVNSNIIHFWFSFYNTELLKKFHVGKYMMEQIIYYAKKQNMKYVYLGTCYGEKALYKVRDFKGIEFFDGSKWNNQINILKEMCKKDII